MGIFSELRDRRLFQIVASYLAAGWIALEVVDQFVDRGIVPEVAYEVILIAYLCGIPAFLLIGWYHGEKGVQRAPRTEIVMLSGIGVLFLVLSSFSVNNYRTERLAQLAALNDAGADLRKIAVLYFRDFTPNAEYQHVADGLTEALIDELSRVPALEVVTRNGAAVFRGSELPRDSIGRALGVGTVVEGSVEGTGDRLRITVRVFDGHSGSEFRNVTIQDRPDQILTARNRVVEDVARLLRSWVGEEFKIRQGGHRLTNTAAWTLYQRAERARKQAEAAVKDGNAHAASIAWAHADSLAGQAAVLAPEWPDPQLLRGTIAYRRSRSAHDPEQVLKLADQALTYAERVILSAPTHAHALELRGTVTYWKYIRTRATAPEDAPRLLASARRDLEEAVRIQPLLASAHSTLSHLLYREDVSSALLAARRAYEADAYLDVASDVVFRLVAGNYDIENFDQMQRWCNEGAKRFAGDPRFKECQLLLLTTRQAEPEIDRAWTLQQELEKLTPDRMRAYKRAFGTALVGGTIARASRAGAGNAVLADSARAVLRRAVDMITPQIDPEQSLLPQTAYMYSLLGDNQAAVDLLRRHAATNPHYSFEHHWWWRDLRGTPEFQPLLAQRQRPAHRSSH